MQADPFEPRRRLVMLTITEACNLDCLYCYEKSKTPRSMDLETAKSILRREFEASNGFDEIEIDFFGGEPCLKQDFIKDLVGWVRTSNFKKPFIFFLQTNGTLVHGDFQKWLIENKSYVNVGLSLDGTPGTHNANRSGSYGMIDIDFFVKNYPLQGARMTVHPETVGSLFDDVVHMHDLGFKRIDVFFAHGVDWSVEGVVPSLEAQLKRLCDHYIEHPELNECSIFDVNIAGLAGDENKTRKWCGTGTEIVSVGVDGKTYPCQAFQPNTTSHPIESGTIKFEDIADFSDPECASCPVEQLCPNCYGLNHVTNGDMLRRDKRHCGVTMAQVSAVAYLRACQISNGLRKMTPAEEYQTIKAIGALQNIPAASK